MTTASNQHKEILTSSIAKEVRWLQLQVVSSGVTLTTEQPAEFQPPPPPKQNRTITNRNIHTCGNLALNQLNWPCVYSPFRVKSQNTQEAVKFACDQRTNQKYW